MRSLLRAVGCRRGRRPTSLSLRPGPMGGCFLVLFVSLSLFYLSLVFVFCHFVLLCNLVLEHLLTVQAYESSAQDLHLHRSYLQSRGETDTRHCLTTKGRHPHVFILSVLIPEPLFIRNLIVSVSTRCNQQLRPHLRCRAPACRSHRAPLPTSRARTAPRSSPLYTWPLSCHLLPCTTLPASPLRNPTSIHPHRPHHLTPCRLPKQSRPGAAPRLQRQQASPRTTTLLCPHRLHDPAKSYR